MWISVKDRLPMDDAYCAVLTDGMWPDCACFNDPNGFPSYWLTPGSIMLERVTHWMALPEPPK